MKHAGDESLDKLEDLLTELRKITQLREKKRGVFYLKSAAFLHFHGDPTGMHADLRLDGDWQRIRVETRVEQRRLLTLIRSALEE
jgi:hypothetical protein